MKMLGRRLRSVVRSINTLDCISVEWHARKLESDIVPHSSIAASENSKCVRDLIDNSLVARIYVGRRVV